MTNLSSPASPIPRTREIQGRGCGIGRVRGTLVRKHKNDDLAVNLNEGEIWLLLRPLDADIVLAASAASVRGLLATVGGCTAHGATIAREVGLPLVIVLNPLMVTADFTHVEMDAATGQIILRE